MTTNHLPTLTFFIIIFTTTFAPKTANGQGVCTLTTITEVNDVLPICCGSTGADDCSTGLPPRCSPECAELLVPFWEMCSGLMQIMGASAFDFDVQALADFASGQCTQSLALVRGAESCSEGTGRGDGNDLQSWVGDVNTACCVQHGINVCRDGDTVPWICALPFAGLRERSALLPW